LRSKEDSLLVEDKPLENPQMEEIVKETKGTNTPSPSERRKNRHKKKAIDDLPPLPKTKKLPNHHE
jgi:hypothetical protein